MKSALLLSIGLLVVSWVFAFEAPPGRTGDVPLLPGPDSTRRSTRWEERVRRSEIEVIRQARPERESLVSCSWTPAELAERVRDRDKKAMRGDERGFVLRVNTLRWLTLTPEAGVEWRLNYRWGVGKCGLGLVERGRWWMSLRALERVTGGSLLLAGRLVRRGVFARGRV